MTLQSLDVMNLTYTKIDLESYSCMKHDSTTIVIIIIQRACSIKNTVYRVYTLCHYHNNMVFCNKHSQHVYRDCARKDEWACQGNWFELEPT